MQWLANVATVLGLTLPLAIGFLVIGAIIVALVIIGGELYSENDSEKKVRDNEYAKRKPHLGTRP